MLSVRRMHSSLNHSRISSSSCSLNCRKEDSSGATMRYHKELIERTCTADAARKGHRTIMLRHHTDGKRVYHGKSILFRHESVEA